MRRKEWIRKILMLMVCLGMMAVILSACGETTAGTGQDTAETETPAAEETAAKTGDGTEMTLYSINVRKADAHLLRCGDVVYLIDTGSKESAAKLLAVLAEEAITRLDGVILTHTDSDHAGGLKALLASGIEIDGIYASGYYNKKKHPAEKAIKKNGQEIPLTYLLGGDSLPFGGGTLAALGPITPDPEKENNNSLVLLASGGGGTILLCGDMEFPEEDSLLKAGLIPQADVIKIGNHGESDATSNLFLVTVNPKVAVISTNTEDEPDTPAARVMKLLNSVGCTVYQTQETKNGVLISLKNGEIAAEYR